MPRQENIPNRLPVLRTMEKPELLERGLFILHRLGLNIEDLKDKKIADIGSNQAAIETLLKQQGINNIISIESRLPWMSSNKELNQINATAKKLPIKDSSIDLIIAHAGPPTTHNRNKYKENKEILNSEEKRVLSYLEEFKRVLTKDGEARIAPARLWFIYMNDLNNIYQGKEELNNEEQDTLFRMAETESTEYLQKKYNISLHDTILPENQKWSYLDEHFWIMKKE